MLRHAQTLSNKMRDFRWVVSSNNNTMIECEFPYIPVSASQAKSIGERWGLESGEGDMCYQPIVWNAKTLDKTGETENGEAVYSA